jgi:hypothetical protein
MGLTAAPPRYFRQIRVRERTGQRYFSAAIIALALDAMLFNFGFQFFQIGLRKRQVSAAVVAARYAGIVHFRPQPLRLVEWQRARPKRWHASFKVFLHYSLAKALGGLDAFVLA